MAIPDFQTIMLPLLRIAADGVEHTVREAAQTLADEFKLTDDEREQLVPSGQQRTFLNRVSWAVSVPEAGDVARKPWTGTLPDQ